MEAQKERQAALRLKILREQDRGFYVVDSTFSSRLIGLRYDLEKAVSSGFCARGELRNARADLENCIAIIETVISDSERGGKPSCTPDVLEFLKKSCERLERQFVRKTIALNRCCDDIRCCENNIREELKTLSRWIEERSEAAQERAAELVGESEKCLGDVQGKLPQLIVESNIQLHGIEEKKVSAGVNKWRQQRHEARQVMALEEAGSLAGGFGFSARAFLNPLARPPMEV